MRKNRAFSIVLWSAVLAVALTFAGKGVAETFADDFNRLDTGVAAAESESSILGKDYLVTCGNWSIANQALRAEGKSFKILLLAGQELSGEDFTLAVDFQWENPSDPKAAIGLLFNYEGAGDYCIGKISGGGGGVLQVVQVWDRKKKSETQADGPRDKTMQKYPLTQTVQPEIWYRLTIQGYSDGRYECSVVQRDLPEQILAVGGGKILLKGSPGKVGLFASTPVRVSFDNFTLQKP